MKRHHLFIILTILIFSSQGVSGTDFNPVFHKTMTGTCIMVGNTNTELVDPIDFASLTKEEALEKEKGDIKEINVDGSSSTSTLTITNSNFADFCTINPDIECGKSNIKYARLTWGGRLQDGVTPDHREEVYVKLDNSTYTLVTSEKTTKAGGPSLGYYSCHADVTDLIKNIIVGNAPIESHRIYVANIQTALNEFTSDATNIPGLCSGWSLTIVYSHPLLPKKNVLVYDCDVLGESNRAGFTPDAIIANFLTDSIANNILNETITFGFSALGGFNSIDGELILQNSDNKIEGKNYNSYKMTNYLSFIDAGGSETSTNPIGSSIYYNYKNGACDIMYRNGYTRGFDLKAFPILAEKYQPTKGAPVFTDAFKLCITPDNEFHYLTNAILMVGAANLPETKLTISSTETTLEPGKEYSTKLYVSVGENQESMRNIKLNIPFSEYIDSVTSISIKVTPQKIVNGYLYYSPKDGSVLPREALYILNGNSTNTKSAEKRILTNINTYLSLLNKNNANYAKTTPYLIENGFVTLDFRELEVPADVKYQDIITINLTLKTKPEGDWSYEKNSKLGKMTVTSPEAEMTVTGINSDQKSVFEGSTKELKDEKSWNDYKCELLSDGSSSGGGSGSGTGGGTGDCAGLNNEETFKGGSYIKDKEKQIKISIDADNYCAELPEKIDIYFCNKMEITVDQINELLKTKYSIDTKAIAFEDSCIWEQAKRDSLANFAKIHGVSKSQMDELLGAKKIVTFAKYGENRENLDAKLKCRGADVDLLADDIDDIINMPDTVTKVYVLFTAEDTLSKYEVSPSYDYAIDINDDNKAGETYEITEDKTLYILYDSPWRVGENGTSKDCDVFIPINFIKKTIDAPILTYDNEQLKQRDTLYYCLDGEILPLTIEKTFNEYDVWADIIKDPDNNPTTIDTTIHVDNTYNKSIDWSIKDEKDKDGNIIVDTKIAGNTMIIIKQKSLSDNCIGENDTIVISVSDFKIADKPTIEVVNGENQCESLNPKDSITLKISNNDNNNNVRWYLNEKLPIQHRVLIGESDEINIRQDTSGTFSYSAVFFKDNCESTPETVYVTLNPKADSLKTDTIEICKYYKPTGNEIITKIQGWNSASWNRSNLLFYNYDKSHSSDLTEALSYAISQDSVVLDTLVNLLQTAEDCPAEGYYFLNFVVQGKTAKGCLGAGSLVTLKVNCYNREEPTMEDSTLYCTGDTPTKNIFDFLDQETSKFTQGNKWFWKEETSSVALPENRIGNDVYKTIPDSYDPNTSTLAANSHKFIVVRVDSNNCVSLPDTFKIVVADAINSFAKIGDTTKTISATETSLALNYCKGNIIYSTNRLPAIGYPSKEYIMEWYRKDKVADDCDTLVKYNFDRLLNHVDINFDKVDTTYYCTRQVTAYGCKGPWLNVSMIVHDSVRDIPVIDSSTMVICEGDPSNLIKVSNPDPSQYNLYLYKSDTTEIISNQLTLDTVAGKYLTSLKKNLYFASLKNDITGCYGDLIGIDAIINPKPHLPYPEKDTTVYLCANNEIENLKTKIGADINVLDYNTKLVWEPKESIKTDGNKSALYAVHQIDTVSLCKGEKINIEIKIEKTFDYKPFGKKEFCYGTTISLCDSVEKSIKANNIFIPNNNIGYKVYRLNGTSKQTPALDCGQLSKLGSSKTRNASDSTRYLIEVMDTISGCFEKDTATIIFRGLPTIKKIEDIVICQFVDTLLPTPTDNKYSYKWLREDDDQILPKPEKLQLTKSETIRLIANDEMGCYDTLAVNMVVNKEPKSAIAYSDTFCQNSGIHLVPVTINPSADINAGSIKIEWFGANNDPIKTPINTDTVNMTGLTKVFTYTIRQTVQGSNCFKDTTINITIKKALDLKMLDLDRVCQPNTVDFDTNVWDYLGANTNDVNLANLNNIDVKYAMLNNGTKTDKTKEEVSKLEYMDGKDSVEYIYTVTDADKVCVASDTVFVTINRKPTTPIIENGLDTIYFCKDDAPILLGAKDINPDLTKTDIFWGEYTSAYSNDSLNITESFKKYTAFTKNLETGCVSIPDTIVAFISNSVYFKRFGVKKYCYGEVVDLKDMIQKAINNQNNPQFKSNIGFQVYKVNGTTPNAAPVSKDVLSSLHSMKGRNVDDSTRYYLEVLDSISGCNITDTFSIIFRGLPTIKKIDDIVVCQYADTLLPTPTDSRYEYHWLRANDKEILPMPAVLQLEKSETIRLVAVDTMDCKDTLAVYMDVKKIPTSAIAYNDTFCQNSGTHLIPVSTQASEDNETESLSIQWFSEQMDSINNPINTDSVEMNGLRKVIPYTIRQTNRITGCYKDTTIHITINKALDLRMKDVERVCQPEIVDFDTEVWDYLQSNTAAVNLTNLDNINVEYALLNNGNKKPMTKEEVAKLEYMEGKDSVSYIYTVTDGKKVCVASDTVFVTINRKPTTPIIENGLDTIYFCKDDAPILLGAKDINPDQTKTNIFWGEYTSAYSNDSLNITEAYKTYIAFSKEMETGCVSIPDTIVAFISGSLNFKGFGVKKYCYGEVVNLDSMITDAIKAQNHSEFKSNIGYQLYKMNGTAASAAINKDLLSSLHSTKGRNVDDSTRYSLEVVDSISGCRISDEFSIIFRGLPTIKKIDDIVVCQYADTLLPTPTDSRYEYKWLRADDREILPQPEKLQLEKSETIRVVAIDTMGCSDTLEVYMDVKKIPTSAIAYNDTFCQNTGVHLVPVSTKASEDNASGSLSIKWFSEQMDSISKPINTDSVEMNGLRKVIPYTIRQTNRITGCYKDTTIQITINKALDLRMQDVERVCQPEIVDFDTKVWDYLLSNTEAVNLTNIDNINVEYALLNNGNKNPMTKEEVSKLEYMDGKDSVSYIYTVTDAEKVCVASDTVFVTINRKPSIPVIENGMDTIYFCKDNAPLYIKAKDKNIYTTLTDIFWGEYENGTKGDSLLISENKNDMLYIAYSQNNYTTCVSDPDSIIVIVASPIETKTIGKNGTIELCVNEHINVMDTAKASFIIDKKRLSVIKYSITANGFDIAENELADVTKTVQDTTNYVFTVKDELTGCETTNKLRLIFHQKPTFGIEGKSTLCQGNDMELKAVGENRAVSYVWLTEGQDKVESTTSTFTLKNIMADTTILLVERLEGTSCYDTITQKIKVYETPAQLEDREFIFCQDSKGADEKVFIKRDEQDSIKFRLQWLDDDNTEMFQGETIDIPVVKDTVYTYLVKQLNIQTDTVCHGELSEVSFRINKHTDVTLRDTNVCMPEPFNLAAYAKNKRKESTTGYELAIDRITFLSNGIDSDIEDSTKVTQTGIYKIHYTDKNGCETENTTKVNFINKPDMPAFKVDMPIYLCQGVDTVIVPNLIAGDYIYIWNKIGGNDTITSDTLKITAEKASGSPIQYQVWRKDSIYGCESEKADISYQVLDSIKITIPETLHICEYETIDLDSVGHTLFSSENTLELKAFNSNEMAETLNQLLYYNAISDSGYYLIKVKDVVSNCQAKALVKLDIHEAPILLFDGDTTVCSGDKIELKAKPSEGKAEPTYQWIDARGKTIDGKTLAYISTIDEMGEFDPLPLGEETARLDTVQLIGLYNITNDKICQKERSVALTINPIPQKLENDTVDICQKTGIVNIPVNYQNNVYDLKMYKESTEITAIEVNTENIGEQKFETRTENRLTQCLSEPAWVLANVRSAIQLNLDTIQGICEPEVFNLEEIVNKSALSSNEELLEAKTYTITSITRNGIEVTDRNTIDKSGLYHTVISDQYGCTAKDTIRLAVNKQPESISGDTVFCQNTGIQILNEKGTNSDLVVEWLDLEFAYPDSIFSETMKIKTDIAETRNYLIRQKFPSSNCASVPTPMTVTIHPAIHSDLRDTTICYGNTFDLPAYAQNHVSEGTEPSVLNYRRTETIIPLDYNAIAQKGTFIVNYTDKNSCSANDTMTLSIAPKMELKLEGNKPVCNGNNINIKASGADHYVWNEVSEDIDSINIATSGVGVTDITLSASIDVNEETSCNLDTIISITVNKVPDLIQDYGDTLYCQNAETEALSLNATDNDAKVLWYDPNDNYSAVSQNGTLRPASMYDGEFIYKFRQQLGECYTEMQDYPVNIQKAIEEVAVVRDTAYCKDEKTAPLSATWTNPQYELIWTDEEGNVLPNVYEPSSAVAGIRKYEAKLSFKACMGQPAKMTVSVQERYNEIPDVNESFIFCEKTGSYTLKANNKKDGVRLNWYQDGSDERMDSIIINTDESTWKSSSFYATQSIINGCESQSKTVDVTIADAIKPMTIDIDTCANLDIRLSEIMNSYEIKETADKLWNGTDQTNRMDINSNIGHTGNYQFSVVNQNGCRAVHTINVQMMQPEDFIYPIVNKTYCFDDTISLNASSSNATMTWEDQSTGDVLYGNSFISKLDGETDILLIATVTNKPVCQDTVSLTIKTYPKIEAEVIGKTNVCLDSAINLTTGNLYQTVWTVGDSTIAGDDFRYTPSKSELVQVYGLDKNKCPVTKTISINTVNNPDPKIIINPMIASATYHLNRDTFDVRLEGVITAPLDHNYTYYWDFGDGYKDTESNSSTVEHSYDANLVRLTKPINVQLIVTHEYGCKGMAVATVLIDPDFEVPNTMTPEDEFMKDYELQIYDRIGNLIYEGIGWHGQKNNGEEAFADTYFYAITYYISGEKKIKTGYITLVR